LAAKEKEKKKSSGGGMGVLDKMSRYFNAKNKE